MSAEQRKAKIIWQCRRGMLELDLLLSWFMTNHFAALSLPQVDALENLLTYSDPEIYAWLLDQEEPPDKELIAIVAFIRGHYPAEAIS